MNYKSIISVALVSLSASWVYGVNTVKEETVFENKVAFNKSVYASNIYVEHPTYPSSIYFDCGYYPKSPLSLRVKGTGDAFYNCLTFQLDSLLGESSWKIATYIGTPTTTRPPAPLMFESSAYDFRGGELNIAPKVSDAYRPTAKITDAGEFYGTSLVLNPGVVESYKKNPRMYFQFDEETQGWKLSVERPSVHEGTPIPFTIETSELLVKNGNLVVNGTIECQKSLKVAEVDAKSLRANDIKVDMNNAADYVFEENYDLKSLSEVEAYVKANKHLPGVPSATELKSEGMSVSEMTNLLLEKVEELTLHLIRVEKENQALKAEIEALKKR